MLYSFGITDQQMAKLLGVNVRTIHRWKKNDQAFKELVQRGKQMADDMVEQSLFKCAMGFYTKEVKTYHYHGKIISEEVDVFYPPNGRDALNWLRIRRAEEWGDSRQRDGETTPEIGEVNVYVSGSRSTLLQSSDKD